MKLNADNLKRLSGFLYIKDANERFGSEGAHAVNKLINDLMLFFQRVPPESVDGGVLFYRPLEKNSEDTLESTLEPSYHRLLQYDALVDVLDSLASGHSLVVSRAEDGRFSVMIVSQFPDPKELSNSGVVCLNKDKQDTFYIGGGDGRVVPKVMDGLHSAFAVPTLASLRDALEVYERHARNVTCRILRNVWVGGADGHRLVFVNRPEAIMRDSLCNFLGMRLDDATVRPEHNTDETKPVDIVVNWFGSTARALIEVKWLGKSVTARSEAAEEERFTSYWDSRAQQGFDQLADYLDREAKTDPNAAPIGYLVVFDGRRKGVERSDVAITKEDAEYYRDRPIEYERDHSSVRRDMEVPFRFFLAVKESLCLASRPTSGGS